MSGTTDEAKLVRWQEPVQPAWIDYNGHLSEAYYVLLFGFALDPPHRGSAP